MNNPKRIEQITDLYNEFIRRLKIDSETGVLGVIANSRLKDQLNNIRFSGFPFIGSLYDESEPKILVVGLDTGVDERKNMTPSFHTLSTRNERIEPRVQSKNWYGPHMAGTYGLVMYLLKDFYGWDEYWNRFFAGKRSTFEIILKQYGPTVLPYDVLSRVAFTNLHKFVSIERKRRSGGENRVWYNPVVEKQLFLDEVIAFSPDIIYIQNRSFNWSILQELKKRNYRIVMADHPSWWCNAANTPLSVDKLTYINW